ncbi:MAG: mycothiol transferase [Trebonia sp.]
MTSAELLTDAFGRIRETVENALDAMSPAQLAQRIDADANPVSWLIWHLTRIQDDHIAGAFGAPQVWETGKWAERLGLPEDTLDTGYGHSSRHVASVAEAVSASPSRLLEYHDATYEQTLKHVSALTDGDLSRVVDGSWTPPVTLGVRLISVVDDNTQHAGQAVFVRGILLRR